ncbi:SAF domain-containing protein [Pyxidicoccus sp. 3LFB2]
MTAPAPTSKGLRLLLGGVFVGLMMGLPLTGLVGGILAHVLVTEAADDARKGWELVPVIVASKALASGDPVTYEAIAERRLPARLVTSSFVKPDSARYIVSQALIAPLAAGEPLRWGSFEVGAPSFKAGAPQVLGEECKRAHDARPAASRPEQSAEQIRARLLEEAPR